ncbi:acyltransferase family protein [Microdochium nivale]|nr:acyltransferase family protein [Microdochium nivale]
MLYTKLTSFQARNDDDNADAEALLPDGDLDTVSLRASTPTRIPARARVSALGRTLARSCLDFIIFLKPSFINLTSSATEGHPPAPARPPSKTQYLDGMRGIASLIVVNLHWSRETFPSVNSGWGYGDNHGFFLLSFVRLVHCGAAMVSLFFVISGYVTAYRPVQQMHRGEHAALYRGLTSSTFRRGIRLYAPAVASALLTFVAASLGLVHIPPRSGGKPLHHGVLAFLQFLDFESNVWTWDLASAGFYNPQFWTISLQFRGSMVLYVAIAGLAGSRAPVRMLVETAAMAHACAHMRWDIALFLAGMVLAEVDVLVDMYKERNKEVNNSSSTRGWTSLSSSSSSSSLWLRGRGMLGAVVKNTFLCAVLVAGLYLSGYPRDHDGETPGYSWSTQVWPHSRYRRRFWLGVGAVLLATAAAFLGPVQRVFTTRVALYLGRISFALFLVHKLVIRMVGDRLLALCQQMLGVKMAGKEHQYGGVEQDELEDRHVRDDDGNPGGTTDDWAYAASFILATAMVYPLAIWAADVFWRGVEMPSTTLARWAEHKCMLPRPAPAEPKE